MTDKLKREFESLRASYLSGEFNTEHLRLILARFYGVTDRANQNIVLSALLHS